jgi:hypothetical protein
LKHWLLEILKFLLPTALCGDIGMPTSIQEVKKKHEARLLAMPGVVSVGIGRDEDGNPAIIVGLDGPRPETVAQLPQFLEDWPVLIQIIGTIKAH